MTGGPRGGGLDAWHEWLDGRPRRLKRGKHYTGDARDVVRQAREAAAGLGKTAVVSRDSSGKYDYLWVRFVDGEVEPGAPCPACGGTELEKTQKHFLRCSTCGAALKAANDWEVVAGEFAPSPASWTSNGALPESPPAEEFVEVAGLRLVSVDGHGLARPVPTEDFLIALSLTFLRPVDAALLRVKLSVEQAGPLVRLQPPTSLHVPTPQTVHARLRVPGGLLVPRRYRVEVVVLIVEDMARPRDYVKLMAADAFGFTVRKDGPTNIGEGIVLPSPFDWEIAARPSELR